MIGTMLRFNHSDSHESVAARTLLREKRIIDRRNRIEEETRKFGNDNGGVFEKILSMSVVGIIANNINKLYDKMEEKGIHNYDSAKAFLSKVDSSASGEKIDKILEMMEKHVERFDKSIMIERMNNYEYSISQESKELKELELQQEIIQHEQVLEAEEVKLEKEIALSRVDLAMM